MAPLNVEKYEDFVLKLKIKAADGTSQIRRVRLPRIADQAGNVSYEELVGLVVTFTFPDQSSPENFDCTLTYFDEDDDTVTIASTTELVDAVEQFVDKRVLRISTEVKRKSPRTQSAPETPRTPPSGNGTTDRGTSTKPEKIEPNLQNVLESFVGVLVSAVGSLEKEISSTPLNGVNRGNAGVDTPRPPAKTKPEASEKPCAKPAAKPTGIPTSVDHPSLSPKASEDKPVPFVHRRHTCDSCLMNPIVGARYHAVNLPDYDLCENCYPNYSGKETEFISHPSGERFVREVAAPEPAAMLAAAMPTQQPEPTAASEPAAVPPAATETQDNGVPFIHGRHTCDSCLTTPIIGKRFHARNMKDYDLCERCHANYEGTEIEFDEVELSRDKAFQKRWNRRRQRMGKMNGKRPGRRYGRGRKCADRAPEAPTPEPTPAPEPTPSDPPTDQNSERNGARVIPIQSSAPSAPTTDIVDEFDDALKEAIRRSLEDVMPKDDVSDVFECFEAPQTVAPSAPTEAEVNETLTTCAATEVVLDDPPATDEAEQVESVPITEEDSPEDSNLVQEVDEQRLLESMEETMSVDSEQLVTDDADAKPAAVDRETSMSTPERKVTATERADSPGTVGDDSFALDAVGNGDVAEAMGATLDIVAGVISEMLSEADAHNNATDSEEVPDDIVVDGGEKIEDTDGDVATDRVADATSAGALILESEDGAEEPKEEVDGWQVVDENTNESSDIANATQMLGSALFNSEMRNSDAMDLNSSDAFSASSSVPSDLPSISVGTEVSSVSNSQRARWASQLYMLREMGFEDEKKCIDTLERLHAANIGCDEEAEVSVTQVVEAMLSEQN